MIVGIGELLWDVFPDGRKVAGGAPFNFAFHCKQLGHDAIIVSRVGDDDLGRELRAEVRRLGLSDEYVQTDPVLPTGTVQVSVDANGQPAYTIAEDVAWDWITWDDQLSRLADRAQGLCFGTLAQRTEVSGNAVAWFAKLASGGGQGYYRIFDINLRQHFFSRAAISYGISQSPVLKVSEEELPLVAETLGIGGRTVREWTRGLFEHNPTETRQIFVTRGAGGAESYFFRDADPVCEPPVPTRVADTVGAGDAFSAALMCMMIEHRRPPELLRFANHYAARVCEHRGATPRIDRAEVERAAFTN